MCARAAAKERDERQRKRDAITQPSDSNDGSSERVVLYTQVWPRTHPTLICAICVTLITYCITTLICTYPAAIFRSRVLYK